MGSCASWAPACFAGAFFFFFRFAGCSLSPPPLSPPPPPATKLSPNVARTCATAFVRNSSARRLQSVRM